MARTALVAGLVALVRDGNAVPATQAADAANGNVLPFNIGTTPPTFGPLNVVLAVTNGGGASINVILRASGYTGAASGAANSGLPAAANVVFTQATVGDLVIPVAAGATQYVGPLTTDRFVQPDHVRGGELWIDWSSGTSVTVSALLFPTNTL